MNDSILALAKETIRLGKTHKKVVAVAESCTGGLIAAYLTAIPGSSSVFDRGFVTYSNAAKHDLLDVPVSLIETDGAVSASVAESMAQGALAASKADVAVSVTGIAGPGGGSAHKAVGLVFMGQLSTTQPLSHQQFQFEGNREEVRLQTVEKALEAICFLLSAQ
ncbi:MAG: CinA family protein [Bacteroidota bacterium]